MSAPIPAPVSQIRTAAWPSPRLSIDTVVAPPLGVNFTAFCSKLPTTWVRRVRSAWTINRTPLGRQRKLHAGSCKQVAVVLDRPADQLVEVHRLLFKPDLAARDPRDVEKIVDQTGQVRNLALDHRFSTLDLLAIAANMLKDVTGCS